MQLITTDLESAPSSTLLTSLPIAAIRHAIDGALQEIGGLAHRLSCQLLMGVYAGNAEKLSPRLQERPSTASTCFSSPRTGEVLERLEMPPGVGVSGLESDGGDQFFCGGGRSGKVRTVRRPRRRPATGSGAAEIPVDSSST
jgi:hypothetical protein